MSTPRKRCTMTSKNNTLHYSCICTCFNWHETKNRDCSHFFPLRVCVCYWDVQWIPEKHCIIRFQCANWTRDALNWMMGSKPNKWETAAPGRPRLTLWNKTIHFLFCEAWEELLASVLFGQASEEPGHGEGCQRQRNTCTHTRTHTCTHTCTWTKSLSLHNDCLSLSVVILEADEGTSRHIGKRKLCVKMSHIFTNCSKYSGYLWLITLI